MPAWDFAALSPSLSPGVGGAELGPAAPGQSRRGAGGKPPEQHPRPGAREAPVLRVMAELPHPLSGCFIRWQT